MEHTMSGINNIMYLHDNEIKNELSFPFHPFA